jgi:hypothetical protein
LKRRALKARRFLVLTPKVRVRYFFSIDKSAYIVPLGREENRMNTQIKMTMAALGLAASCGMCTAASACPNPNLADNYGTYAATGAQLYEKQSYNLQAGGDQRITDCSNVRPRTDRGDGYVTSSPDFSFSLSGMGRYTLILSVISQCDSVLLINTGSTSWYYDDDDNGNADARISLTRPANGRIDVWVGTYDGTLCDAQLSLETFYR